jgi:predicted kinase
MIRLKDILNEGVYDPGILKAVFLAGGPGAGKSYSVQQVFGIDDVMKGTSSSGLKVINSDTAFEHYLKKSGVDPKDLAKMTDKVFQYYTKKPGGPRLKAKDKIKKLRKIYEQGRLGMIIDGTGHNYGKIQKNKKYLESLGYDTSMIFINTSLPVALERNSKRERVLPDDLIEKSWSEVQNNLGKFQSLFGRNFYIIDNTEIGNFQKMHSNKISVINNFINKPIKNPIGKQWIDNELKLKKLG